MATPLQITCIDKDPREDRYHAIKSVAGFGFRYTQQDAVRLIDTGQQDFYVKVGLFRADVVTEESSWGHRYLKTSSDGFAADNLLSLPQCQ